MKKPKTIVIEFSLADLSTIISALDLAQFKENTVSIDLQVRPNTQYGQLRQFIEDVRNKELEVKS